jgi:hypothetical protein
MAAAEQQYEQHCTHALNVAKSSSLLYAGVTIDAAKAFHALPSMVLPLKSSQLQSIAAEEQKGTCQSLLELLLLCELAQLLALLRSC